MLESEVFARKDGSVAEGFHADAMRLTSRDASDKIEGLQDGVLVLVNDVDIELLDGHDTRIVSGDRVAYMSLMHGG
ncbi:ubiquitin-related modifier 1 [Kipferlia bialata]|uniref:Ubiquitin-related modifier 1 n=1 Tax=Kipferlia bialata TaxID=797122 RepID=A0A9K3GJK5_9EUKA|nr:ubiquitin-related modifier 1 [Kipferlia bialata]|eukprot:g6980.t1